MASKAWYIRAWSDAWDTNQGKRTNKTSKRIMKDNGFYGVMAPWIFIVGVCAVMIVLLVIDAVFNLGLAIWKK